jgi:hypothetical protein
MRRSKDAPEEVVREAERVVRRVPARSVWLPFLLAACVGFLAAVLVAVVVVASWHPDGMGI